MKTFHIGGIHPPETKLTARRPVADVAIPAEIALMLSQQIGAPAKPVVAKGDHVDRGQLVAEAGGFVSAPVHTPVSGTVMRRMVPSQLAPEIWEDSSRDTWIWLMADTTVRMPIIRYLIR